MASKVKLLLFFLAICVSSTMVLIFYHIHKDLRQNYITTSSVKLVRLQKGEEWRLIQQCGPWNKKRTIHFNYISCSFFSVLFVSQRASSNTHITHLIVYTTSRLEATTAIAATFAPAGWPWFVHLFYIYWQNRTEISNICLWLNLLDSNMCSKTWVLPWRLNRIKFYQCSILCTEITSSVDNATTQTRHYDRYQ